jgi:hypothetical protein
MEVPMHDLTDWDRLDDVAFRLSMKRSVRHVGRFLVVMGTIVAVAASVGGMVPLIVVGSALLCAGVWNAWRPSIHGLVVDSGAMILTGAFNSMSGYWEDAGQPLGKWTIAGVIQIMWGIRRLAVYPMARRAPDDREAMARLESIVRELSARRAKDDSNVVEFRTGRFQHHRNRLGLYPEGVVGLLEQQAIRLERRADISIEHGGTIWHGQSIEVAVQMSDLQLRGRMPASHFERFERWKMGMSLPRSIAA